MQTHIVAKTLVFNHRGELLLIRRSPDDSHRPGEPDLPGGQVEASEEIVAGAVREAREETGLVLDPSAMQLVHAETYMGYQNEVNENINFVKLIFVIRTEADHQSVRLSSEHTAYEWLLPDAIPADDPTYAKYAGLVAYLRDNDIAHGTWSPASVSR